MIAIGDINLSLGARLLDCRVPRTMWDNDGESYEVILTLDDGKELIIDATSISVGRWQLDDR